MIKLFKIGMSAFKILILSLELTKLKFSEMYEQAVIMSFNIML